MKDRLDDPSHHEQTFYYVATFLYGVFNIYTYKDTLIYIFCNKYIYISMVIRSDISLLFMVTSSCCLPNRRPRAVTKNCLQGDIISCFCSTAVGHSNISRSSTTTAPIAEITTIATTTNTAAATTTTTTAAAAAAATTTTTTAAASITTTAAAATTTTTTTAAAAATTTTTTTTLLVVVEVVVAIIVVVVEVVGIYNIFWFFYC